MTQPLHPVGTSDGGEWINAGPYRVLSEEELNALPSDGSRNFNLHGVFVPLVKCPDGTWRVVSRRGVPAYVLAGHPSAPRARRVPGAA